MLIKFAFAVLVSVAVFSNASAQTIGPTPTDYPPGYTPEGTPPPTDPGWTPSPTPGPSPTEVPYVFTPDPLRPTWIPIDAGGLYESLGQANQMLQGVQGGLSSSLLPLANIQPIFSYAKWLISPNSAEEIMGPFAPLVIHTGVFIGLLIATGGIYVVVYAAVYLIKFVVWIFKMILLLVDTVVSVVGSIFRFFF